MEGKDCRRIMCRCIQEETAANAVRIGDTVCYRNDVRYKRRK